MMRRFPKHWFSLMLIMLLTLAAASAVWAGPRGMGGGPGTGMDYGMCPAMGMGHGKGMGQGMGAMQMTPEQAAQAFDLHQKFMNDTAELRKQMLVKRAELGELWRAKEPDKAKIAAKQKEFNALRDQFQEKAIAYKIDMRQHCPMMGQGPGPKAPAKQ